MAAVAAHLRGGRQRPWSRTRDLDPTVRQDLSGDLDQPGPSATPGPHPVAVLDGVAHRLVDGEHEVLLRRHRPAVPAEPGIDALARFGRGGQIGGQREEELPLGGDRSATQIVLIAGRDHGEIVPLMAEVRTRWRPSEPSSERGIRSS